jgi:membrane protein
VIRRALSSLASRARALFGRILRTTSAAAGKYTIDRGPQLSAAISYHVLFSLVPLFTFLVSIFALLLQDDSRRQDLINSLLDRFPLSEDAGLDLDRILSNIPTPASVIGIISIIGFLWSASGMMGSLRIGLTAAFDDGTKRAYFHSKLVDLLLVLSIGALFLLSFGLSIAIHAVERWNSDVADFLSSIGLGEGGVLGTVFPLLVTFAAFASLYHFVPPSRPGLRDVWVGALVGTIAFELVKVGFSFYLGTLATYDVVYGSLGSLFAFLFVVYLQASVVLFCGEFAYQWPRNAEPPAVQSQPPSTVSLPRRALAIVRGLFVRDDSAPDTTEGRPTPPEREP